MAYSAFDDKTHSPTEAELAAVLGEAAERWKELIAGIRTRFGPLTEDWIFSGKKWGWALRLKHEKRAVLYLTPAENTFYAGFVLGKRAVEAARDSDLPMGVLDAIDNAQDYAEGKALRLEILTGREVEAAVKIAIAKMSH